MFVTQHLLEYVAPLLDFAGNIAETIHFSEDETNMLMSGGSLDTFPEDLRKKSRLLGIDDWLAAIPRNLGILFKLTDD